MKTYLWPTRKGCIKLPDLGSSALTLVADLWATDATDGWSAPGTRLFVVEKGGE